MSRCGRVDEKNTSKEGVLGQNSGEEGVLDSEGVQCQPNMSEAGR